MKQVERSLYTVRVLYPGAELSTTLGRDGKAVFSLSVAYQHANKWLKKNPTGDYFINSVHPQRPSFYRHRLTFKYPWH